jgi:RNA polymerase sigma-70 factor, ECF subfamily
VTAAAEDATELMRQIAGGREAALSRLIARHGRGLTLFATRFLGSASEADEVVQDTFLQVWRQADRYDPARAAVSTWLYRIAANRCIDRQRRARVRRFLGIGGRVEDLAEVLPDPAPGAWSQVAARQRLAQVRHALMRLPDRQRMALLLCAVGGMDTAEIAAIMAASPGAVEQLLVRARKALRDQVPDDDLEEDRDAAR